MPCRDDHEVLCKGVRTLIAESGRDWEICGEAAAAEAIEAVKRLRPVGHYQNQPERGGV